MHVIVHVSSSKTLYSRHLSDRKVSLIERCPHFRGQNVHNANVIQWNLSIPDTLGKGKTLPNIEGSSFQGSKSIQS